jgi:hypothetical protein
VRKRFPAPVSVRPVLCAAIAAFLALRFDVASAAPKIRVESVTDSRVTLVEGRRRATLAPGERFGPWTLMAVSSDGYTVLEDFTVRDGRLLVVHGGDLLLDVAKTSEPTFATAPLYLGHTLEEVRASATDLLADELLKGSADPDYARVAAALPPIQKVRANVYSFVGTPDTSDKVPFNYGGRTPNFDPAVFQPSIRDVRRAGKVWDGRIGSYLPVLRFVYPEGEGTWTEMIAFAQTGRINDNDRVQPVWYRVARVESGQLQWARYVDTYLPYPPRGEGSAVQFYSDLAWQVSDSKRPADGRMQVTLPDKHLQNLAMFSLERVLATRVQGFPKYGVVETNYGGSEHDGFPDTFTVETAAFIDWGRLDRAAGNIDNYFGKFVRDDGSIVYRGPETGQFGRMLTVLAQYVNAGGDPALLLKHRARIDGLTKVLLSMRAKALNLPADDPAHGLLVGWSEADAVLDEDPQRYMQPYYSNSTEASRGFRDLGRVWRKLGQARSDGALASWGDWLVSESEALRKDLVASYARSMLDDGGESVLPAIAGVRQPFHIAAARDRLDPQHRSYRAYMEMLYSGSLTREQVGGIVSHRARHHDILLGIPTAYGYDTGEVAGFLAYGHGYGLVQHDYIREALLLTYSLAAHQYTRGTWLAPETRQVIRDTDAAPYCTPAQLAVPMMLRWLLVFEDPNSETLWLGKGIPRDWLLDGQKVSVVRAPTRWGRVSYDIESRGREIRVYVTLPAGGIDAVTKLRLRAARPMKSVKVNGKPWATFDPKEETITLPAGQGGSLEVVARY